MIWLNLLSLINERSNWLLDGVAATSKLHAMKLNGKQAQQVFETDIDGAKEFPNALTMLTTFGMLAQLRNNMRKTRLDVYKVDLSVKSEGQLKRKPVPYCWTYTYRQGDEWSHCRLVCMHCNYSGIRVD